MTKSAIKRRPDGLRFKSPKKTTEKIKYTATYKRNIVFNIFFTFLLATLWFAFYEQPKFIFSRFGIEFDVFCMFILLFVTAQMIMSLFNKHTLKPENKDYVNNLKVALIVPIFNEDKNSIQEGLESCFDQTHTFSQIHVVDDGSQVDYDDTKEWFMRECQLHNVYGTWNYQDNAGKREAHVNAISKIDKENCDIIITIDSDTVLDPYAVEKGLIPFQDKKCMSVAGLVISKNVNTNLLTRITDMLFVAHQRLIDRSSQGLVGQVAVNDGPLAFYRRRVVEVAIKSGYTSETFRGQKVSFSDDSYFTLSALLCGKTKYQPEAIAFTDMPVTFDHHRRQQLRWFRGSFIRGIWRLRYLKTSSYAWFRQASTFIIFFSATWMLGFLLINNFAYTMQTMIPLSVLCSFIYGLRYFSVKRSDVSFISQFATYLLTPFAMLWSMVVLRVLRLYGMITNSKQKWGTRESVESLNDAKEFESSFKKKKGIRWDIEGLRAFAVVSVVIYHFFNWLIPGGFVGVDVFFVISGFIIITTVLNEIKRDGKFSLRGFYGRRIRRILPAATLVLVVGAILIYLWTPVSVWQVFSGDIFAATLYYINFALAFRGVDYMAQGTAESPFQHFWSLSVEEQFYIVTPLLMVVILLISKLFTSFIRVGVDKQEYLRKRFHVFNWIFCASVIGFVAVSLIFCLWFTETNPTMSYFVSPSRFWEMGIGCLIASITALVFSIRKNRASSKRGRKIRLIFANILAPIGMIGLFVSLFVINGDTVWPSVWTLLPVLSTGLVILAGSLTSSGTSNHRSFVAKVLGLRPFVYIGGLTYSIYLWHWVLLIVFAAKFGQNGVLSWWMSIIVIAISVLCAIISNRFVENPIRYSKFISARKRITYSLGVVLMLTSIVAGLLLLRAYNDQVNEMSVTSNEATSINLSSLSQANVFDHFDSISPNPLEALKDTWTINNNQASCFADVNNEDIDAKLCEYGDAGSDKLIIAVGDSMSRVWDSALDDFGKQNHFKVHSYTKSGCLFADALIESPQIGKYYGCKLWGANVLNKILDEKPVMVISTQSEVTAYDDSDNPDRATLSINAANIGIATYWDKITAASIPITVLLDTPNPAQRVGEDELHLPVNYNINDCVSSNIHDLSKCLYYPQLSAQNVQKEMINSYNSDLVSTMDMSKYVCYKNPDTNKSQFTASIGAIDYTLLCPAVVGVDTSYGIDVYRDGPHLTDTFVKTISGSYSSELGKIMVSRGLISD